MKRSIHTRIFDAQSAILARNEAVDRVGRREDPDAVSAMAQALIEVARYSDLLTAEDVWREFPDNLAVAVTVTEPRVMGALFRYASACGWIKPTHEWKQSTMKSCHGRPMRVWQSLLCRSHQ